MIVGFQRRNRKSTITVPTNEEDQTSDEYNQCLKWCDDRDGFQEYFSQAFEGACDVGYSLLHMYPDYTYDPISGDLFTDCVSYNNVLMDPYWRKMDFSDCNGIWRRRWVSSQGAMALVPQYRNEIAKMKPQGVKDGRFPLQAELMNVNTNKLFTYDEFNYRTSREASIIMDPYTGESMEWEQRQDDPENLLDQVLSQQPWLITEKKQVPTVNLIISLGGKTIYDGPNHLGIDRYPFVPVVSNHDPDIQSYQWRMQGVVRNLRDAQYLYNMRKVIEMDILQSQVNSGWVYPVDAVTDSKAFRQTGQGMLIPLKAGKTPQDIERIAPAAIPESLMQLSKSLAEDITAISGVNEELLGSATDDKAGILSMLRQGAGLTTLQTIFDKADYSQRLYGTLRIMAVRKNFSRGKVASILGHEPSEAFFTSHTQKYSIAVEEGNYSATQRQTELQQLLHFREIGVPIANKSIVRAAIITNKKQVQQEMEEEQRAQQQAQEQQMQMESAKAQAEIQAKMAKAQSDQSKSIELKASTQEKLAKVQEILSKAEHNETQADLDLVEMMIKLEDMDLNNLRTSLEIAQIVKQQNEANQNALI